ncbi:hypothetical protein [Pseudomonas sp. 13B_3.2_Bac1]|uniref:hypothetical protein n=1 Tax=Pseudomonas sp. 13B_3.2_Bac1 TaxID=2971623 RepID=UPI0021CA146C|nr:hypothetical protein [Pseudomonas sp. 13B_3.2_Bac1]MCU1772888.1 hypothetical protein [Pseudomonas sp. 13B_3.2_Bac1]
MTVHHSRIQHGVGQGSFHSASVFFNAPTEGSRFDYVYDCGALKSGRKTVELEHNLRRIWVDFRSGSAKPVIDLMILSHFDWDHMNGANELIDQFEVDRIVLPYLGPVELAVILASQAASIDDHTVSDLHSIAVGGNSLWGTPITMVEKGSRQERPDIPERPFKPEFLEQNTRTSENAPSGRATIRVDGPGGTMERVIPDDKDLLAGNTATSHSLDWKIRFWNRGLNVKLGDLIQSELARIGFPVAALNDKVRGAKDIVDWLNVKPRRGRSKKGHGGRKSAAPSSNRDLAVSAYRSALDKFSPGWLKEAEGKRLSNFLSLGMYSGPNFETDDEKIQYYRLHEHPSYENWNWYYEDDIALPGWIGTGDAPLGEASVWDDFELHFKHELPRTQTVVVPHHGAAPRNGPRFYNPKLNHQSDLYAVISHGKRNPYGHPHPSVLSQITRAGGKLVVVTEETRHGFQEEYHFLK